RTLVAFVSSAFWGHCTAANGALSREAGPCFCTFSSNDSKFHLLSFQGANALNQLPDSSGQLRDEAEAHQLFCWFLLLVSVGRRDRWLLMAGVVSPFVFVFL